MLKEFGGVAQLDGGDLGNLGALFARSNKDTPADIQARRQHLAIAAFDKQVGPQILCLCRSALLAVLRSHCWVHTSQEQGA